MQILYNNSQYVAALMNIYLNYKSYYAYGAFGAPANKKNKVRYNVPDAVSPTTFLFDCSGFAYRALPWGWCGALDRAYGGALYPVAGDDLYPLTTGDICSICTDVSKDFSNILPGEVLYMKGHVGIYIGEGKALECTSKWENKILISQVSNVSTSTGIKYKRKWLKHGKLPFINYQVVSDGKEEYTTARMGEGLIRIARRCGISLDEIKRLNPQIKPPAYIVRIGQKVRIK